MRVWLLIILLIDRLLVAMVRRNLDLEADQLAQVDARVVTGVESAAVHGCSKLEGLGAFELAPVEPAAIGFVRTRSTYKVVALSP